MRLIDAQAMLQEFEDADWYDNRDRDAVAETILFDMPTVEVEYVKQGSWIKYDIKERWGPGNYTYWYKCSECQKDAHGFSPDGAWYSFPILSDYCPNCGIKTNKVKK